MIKGVIFDFDGVVVDSERKRFEELKKVLLHNGLEIKKDEFKNMGGEKTAKFLQDHFPNLPAHKIQELAEHRRALERESIGNIELLPGILDVLEYLKEQEIKTALTTGSQSDIVIEILELHNIKDYFDVIVTGEEFEESKPNSECYIITLEKMELEGKEAIVIEDAIAGVEAAKTAGCRVICLLTYLEKSQLAKADVVLKNHYEVLKYLKKALA